MLRIRTARLPRNLHCPSTGTSSCVACAFRPRARTAPRAILVVFVRSSSHPFFSGPSWPLVSRHLQPGGARLVAQVAQDTPLAAAHVGAVECHGRQLLAVQDDVVRSDPDVAIAAHAQDDAGSVAGGLAA